jgi:fumarate hydratase class II
MCVNFTAAPRLAPPRNRAQMSAMTTRTESDTFGPIAVPADHLWGAQTQRSLQNFRIGGETMPVPLIRALGTIKRAAAEANRELGVLDDKLAESII